jgi:hypothetical protein
MTVNINDKFVACWGYDQTQYSIYNVIDVKGKSVIVEGLNSWSTFNNSDLCAGSKVKIYERADWFSLPEPEKVDLTTRGFNKFNYEKWQNEERIKNAPARTIKKVNRIDGNSWTFIWELDNGETISSDDYYDKRLSTHIVRAYKKCLLNTKYSEPSIRINDSITASLDTDYRKNVKAYEEQNLYTAYNGR